MKNLLFSILVIMAIVGLLIETNKKVEFNRKFTIDVSYDNGDRDTIQCEYTRLLGKVDDKNDRKLLLVDFSDDNCISMYTVELGSYVKQKRITCGVRNFNILKTVSSVNILD